MNQSTLQHQAWCAVEQSLGIPEHCKSASAVADLNELPAVAFADPFRRFCIVDAPSTYKSAVDWSCMNDPRSSDPVGDRIKAAALAHNIADDVDKVFDLLGAGFKKSAAQRVGNFAFNLGHDDGTEENFYPINDSFEIEESARGFTKDAFDQRLPSEAVRGIATALVKAAKAQGVPMRALPSFVTRVGVERFPDLDASEALMAQRIKKAGVTGEGAELYMEFVKLARSEGAVLEDIIGLVEEMDHRCSIKIASQTILPHEVFYSGPPVESFEKLANSMAVFGGGESMVPLDVLQRIPENAVRAMFRKEAADSIIASWQVKDASTVSGILQALPEDDQKALLRLALQVAD